MQAKQFDWGTLPPRLFACPYMFAGIAGLGVLLFQSPAKKRASWGWFEAAVAIAKFAKCRRWSAAA